MAYPPDPIAADKAPGPPVSDTEHPSHHNALANAANDIVTELGSNPSGTYGSLTSRLADMLPITVSATEPSPLMVNHIWLDTTV